MAIGRLPSFDPRQDPRFLKALRTLEEAMQCQRLGRNDEADRLYARLIKKNPDYFDGLNLYGLFNYQQGKFPEALRLLQKATTINPRSINALNNLGVVLCRLRRPQEALKAFERALALNPAEAQTLNNRGNALADLKCLDDALISLETALRLQPNYNNARINLGRVLVRLGRFAEALASYDQAIAVAPFDAAAHYNRALVLRHMKRFDEAFASCEKALAAQPNHADSHYCESELSLLLGDFANGWPKYEWRWKTTSSTSPPRNFAQPLWLGAEPLAGKTILLHGEQGLGDTIQFCRYAPLVAERGARVILEVDESLVELMQGLAGVAQVATKGKSLPDFQMHCPLASLPLTFATRLETIPAAVPYLSVPQARLEKWRRKLGQHTALRVGVNWAGNPNFVNDEFRSIGLKAMSPLLSRRDVQFFGIQKNLHPGDVEILQNFPQIVQLGEEIDTFGDTAAIVALMDVVISSDTAVVHLGGALGAPVWTLLSYVPDWRWLLEREDSPWYPTMRLFRQPAPGDWHSVVATVTQMLPLTPSRGAEAAS